MANALSNSLSQISETLSKLKSGLSTISGDEKKKFESSSAPAQLASGLNQLSGTISSSSARRAVDNAKTNNKITTTPTSSDYLDKLNEALGRATTAEANQKKAEAAKTAAEADLSIKEQQQGGIETALAVAKKGEGEETATETTQDTTGQTPVSKLSPEDVATFGLTPEQAADPFTASQVERFKGNSEIIGSTITAMGEMIATESEETKALMANIDAMTKNQQAQITAEYRKRQAGAALAGIIAGHALYSPEEHQGLIAEVVLEGKAKLDEIALEGTKEKIKLQQNLRDFKYKTFVEQSDKLMALNDLKVETVTAIQEELLRVNQEQRDNLLFDQSQEERDATILAEELIDASDEQIIAAAKANGIEPGLLIGAVRQIKPEPVMYSGGGGGGNGNDGAYEQLSQSDQDTVDSYAQDLIDGEITLSNVPADWKNLVMNRKAVMKKEQILNDTPDVDLVTDFMEVIETAKTEEGMPWYKDIFGGKEVDERFQDVSAQAGKASFFTGTKTDIKRMLNTENGKKSLRALRTQEVMSGETLSAAERVKFIMDDLVGYTPINEDGSKGEKVEGVLQSDIDEQQRKKNEQKERRKNIKFPVVPDVTPIKKGNNIWS